MRLVHRRYLMIAHCVLVAVASLGAGTASAATAVCTGRVLMIGNHTPGGLYVQLQGMNMIKFCDFDASQYSVTPNSCRHFASLAAMAYTMEQRIHLYIDNAPTTACDSMWNWFVADTRYLQLMP